MTNTPKLSVVVPAYNAEGTIRRTLAELIKDPASELEVIVVDDLSKDGTCAVVEAMAAADPRIRLIRHPHNRGTFLARISGIQEARAAHVGFCDADDLIEGAALMRMTAVAVEAESDMVIFGILRRVGSGPERIFASFPRRATHQADIFGRFVRREYGAGVMYNKIYRRALLDIPAFATVEKRLVLNEDVIFNIPCFARARRVVVLPDLLYHYVVTEAGQSSSSHGALASVQLYEAFAEALEIFQHEERPFLDGIAELYCNQMLMGYCRVHDSAEYLPYRDRLTAALQRIIRLRPEFVGDFFQRDAPEGNGIGDALRYIRGSCKHLGSAVRRRLGI